MLFWLQGRGAKNIKSGRFLHSLNRQDKGFENSEGGFHQREHCKSVQSEGKNSQNTINKWKEKSLILWIPEQTLRKIQHRWNIQREKSRITLALAFHSEKNKLWNFIIEFREGWSEEIRKWRSGYILQTDGAPQNNISFEWEESSQNKIRKQNRWTASRTKSHQMINLNAFSYYYNSYIYFIIIIAWAFFTPLPIVGSATVKLTCILNLEFSSILPGLMFLVCINLHNGHSLCSLPLLKLFGPLIPVN